MLIIRLSRIGKRKKPMYRLIISEKTKDPYGYALEILGSYNPFSKDLTVKEDRIKHWLSQGAKMSATVNNLLIEKKIITGKKVTASKAKKKKKGETETPKEEKPVVAATETPKEEKPVVKIEEKKEAEDKITEKNEPKKEEKKEEKETKNEEKK